MGNMNNFNEFVDLFFNSEYFVIFLIIVMLILLVIIAYLIKLQSSISKDTLKSQTVADNDILESINLSLNSEIENEPKVEPIIFEDLSNNEEKKNIVINPIEAYELNEEENAIISTKELENIEIERDKEYGKENNALLIQQYEEEQEKKAIISYEELLKNASSLELKCVETNASALDALDAPVIKQVEIESTPFKGVSYAAEEEYLRILKEFKTSLM